MQPGSGVLAIAGSANSKRGRPLRDSLQHCDQHHDRRARRAALGHTAMAVQADLYLSLPGTKSEDGLLNKFPAVSCDRRRPAAAIGVDGAQRELRSLGE